jgi:ribosomal protein S6--L-glutamate ligase
MLLSKKRIAVLSGGQGWHVRDLCRAAEQQGHVTSVIDFRQVSAGIGTAPNDLFSHDAIVVRTMPPGSLEQVVFRMDVLHRAKAKGVTVLNPPLALETCIDKYLSCARLEASSLRVPPTVVCQDADTAMQAFEALGREVVVKPLFGSEGRGMLRIGDPDLAWRVFRAIERVQSVLYVQQFIPHPGWDLRVFVLGDRILAGMKRHARTGWRTNVAQGGIGEPVMVGAAEAEIALRAARATGLVVGGVDLLPAPDGGWYVLEVNAVPGWRALARVCKLDVAAEVIRLLVDW